MLQPPAIIDVEASGFGKGSYPIEVGCVLSDGRGYCALIQPAAGWTYWDPAAEAVHGISRECLARHGLPPLSVAIRLNALLGTSTIYSDAWGHDFSWLCALHEAAGIPRTYRIEHLARITPFVEQAYWNEMRDEVQHSMQLERHRASADARVLQMTWLCVMGGRADPRVGPV
ncbi:MAG: hypothetical protein REI09_03015 [Candidatus Dactylopiibacterium sp.]|nr:hypothetical protein [Candidatus Dactylopiibacterium sp.]